MSRLLLVAALAALAAAPAASQPLTAPSGPIPDGAERPLAVVRDSVRMTRHAYYFETQSPLATDTNGNQYYYFGCDSGIYATWPDVLVDLNLPGGYSRYSRVATGGTSANYVPAGGEATNNPDRGISIPTGFLGHNPNLPTGGQSQPVYPPNSPDRSSCQTYRARAQAAAAGSWPGVLNGAPFQITDWYAVFSVPDGTPIALFEWDQTEGLAAAFDGSFESEQSHEADPTAPGSKRPVASYAWDFGDGASGTGARPTHTYAEPGMYTVTLLVTDDDGQTNDHAETVTVTAGLLTVRVTTETTPVSTGDEVSLVATVTNTGDEAVYSVVADRVFVNVPFYPTSPGARFREPTLTALETGQVTRGSLAPGESFEVSQRYRVDAAGTYQPAGTTGYVPVRTFLESALLNARAETSSGEAARVRDACADGGCDNVTEVRPDGPNLGRRLVIDADSVQANDTLLVRIEVRNTGTVVMTGVVPGELPAVDDVDYGAYDPGRSTPPLFVPVGGGFEPASVGTLARGETASFTARMRVERAALFSNPDGGDYTAIRSTVSFRPGQGAQGVYNGNPVLAGDDCGGEPCRDEVLVRPRDIRVRLRAYVQNSAVEDGAEVTAGLTYNVLVERASFYAGADLQGGCASGCVGLEVELTEDGAPLADETVRLYVPEIPGGDRITARPFGNWLVEPASPGGEPAADDGARLEITTDDEGRASALYFTPGVFENTPVTLRAGVEGDGGAVDEAEDTVDLVVVPNAALERSFTADPLTTAYLRTLAVAAQTAGAGNSVGDYCENSVKWIRSNAPIVGDGAINDATSLRRNATLYLSNLGVSFTCGLLIERIGRAIAGAGPDLDEFDVRDLYLATGRQSLADFFTDLDSNSGTLKKMVQSHLFLYLLSRADMGGRTLGLALPSPEPPPLYASFTGDFYDKALANLTGVMAASQPGASYTVDLDFTEFSTLNAGASFSMPNAELGSVMTFTPSGGGAAAEFRDRSTLLYTPDVFLDTDPDGLTYLQEAVTYVGGAVPASVGEMAVGAFSDMVGSIVQIGDGLNSEINQILAASGGGAPRGDVAARGATAGTGQAGAGQARGEMVTVTLASPTLFAYPEGASVRVLAHGEGGPPAPPSPTVAFDPSDAVRLEWLPGTAVVSHYDVEVATDTLFADVVYAAEDTTALSVRLTDADVEQDRVLYWHVRGTNAAGDGAWSRWLPLVINDRPTGNSDTPPTETTPTTVSLGAPYPNPSRGSVSVSVELPEAGAVRVAVYDALGREVAVALDGERAAGRYPVALPVSALPAGVYVVRLQAGSEVALQRLTVVR